MDSDLNAATKCVFAIYFQRMASQSGKADSDGAHPFSRSGLTIRWKEKRNLCPRAVYPDFVTVLNSGEHHLVETKGQETAEVAYKDRAAENWTENASQLTGVRWRYVKVPQKEFIQLQPTEFADLLVFASSPTLL